MGTEKDTGARSERTSPGHSAAAASGGSGRWAVLWGRSLGLRVRSREAFIRKIREGLDIKALEHFSQAIELTDREIARHVDISARTLARRRQEGRFQADESDRLARVSMLFDQAVALFEGDEKRAAQWFRTPKKALGGASPIEYADTEPGTEEVRDLIGRIEHGVFA